MHLTNEQFAKLRLARTAGIGATNYTKLINRFGSATSAVEMLPSLNKSTNKRPIIAASEADVEKEIKQLAAMGGCFVFLHEENFPELLAQTPNPPAVLSVLGDIRHLHQPQIAVVGNRNTSANGKKFTFDLAKSLIDSGFYVTSGLARGIDTAAHSGALTAGGKTIAVLASGVDNIYPPENRQLAEKIAANGCVVSENPLGTTPNAKLFPRRNRIISGLSYAVVVSEASRHSGSLITSQFAGEQGREVFAVPGSPADPRAAGPNHLIKQGAHVLETIEDITNIVRPEKAPEFSLATVYTREESHEILPEPDVLEIEYGAIETGEECADAVANFADAKQLIVSILSPAPTPVDELIRQSGLNEAEVIIKLTELDLEGVITRHANGDISKNI